MLHPEIDFSGMLLLVSRDFGGDGFQINVVDWSSATGDFHGVIEGKVGPQVTGNMKALVVAGATTPEVTVASITFSIYPNGLPTGPHAGGHVVFSGESALAEHDSYTGAMLRTATTIGVTLGNQFFYVKWFIAGTFITVERPVMTTEGHTGGAPIARPFYAQGIGGK